MAYDLAVVGAGPAGLCAAAVAAEYGANVVLFDDQTALGGQIYRGIEAAESGRKATLGAEYAAGAHVAQRFRVSGAHYEPQATVWQVAGGNELAVTTPAGSRMVRAETVILATGAYERPFPVPGWTLPGAMMAGAAQTLLKSSGVVAEDAVLAGSGPLLYLVAAQYLRAGCRIRAILDTTAPNAVVRAGLHLPAALLRADLIWKGQGWIREVRGSGTEIVTGVSDLRIEGGSAVESVAYRRAGGDWVSIATNNVFLHQGVVPNINLSMAAGVDHQWDEVQICWRPTVDRWGETSSSGLYVAGDGAGISGAVSAAASGEICAFAALAGMGRISADDRERLSFNAYRVWRNEQFIRPFLDRWFRPADSFRVPSDSATVVCRCEEVTRGEIAAIAANGVAGPNQLKAFCRAGMGPCQGRFCGLTVQELLAVETGRTAAEIGYYRLRPPIKPLRLKDIADLETSMADDGA